MFPWPVNVSKVVSGHCNLLFFALSFHVVRIFFSLWTVSYAGMNFSHALTIRANNTSHLQRWRIYRAAYQANLPYSFLQHTSVSPDSKEVIVVGDNADGILADTQSGKVILPRELFDLSLLFSFRNEFSDYWRPIKVMELIEKYTRCSVVLLNGSIYGRTWNSISLTFSTFSFDRLSENWLAI